VFSVLSTDPDNNAVTSVGTSSAANSITTGFISGSITVYAKASTAIQYTMGYASSGATAMVYNLHIVVSGGAVNTTSSTVTTYNGRSGTVTSATTDVATGAILTSPIETVSSSATALSGSTAAALNAATSTFYNYTANPTAAFTVNITNAPTTTGQSVTFAMLVNNGATAYLPLNFTVNGNQAGVSSSVLPVEGATNNGITTWFQGGTAWTAADASTIDSYTFVVICTGSSTWTVLASLTKF
jgi:hypothetical protein